MKYLTTVQKTELSKEFKIELAIVNTVLEIESSGNGFDPKTGEIKIQFEPYWFQKYTGHRIANGVENQLAEWKAFRQAEALDKTDAIKSTSWGLGQVMGFNHQAAGFFSPEKMVEAFKQSEEAQLRGMLEFIRSHPPMYKALVSKDWRTFARHYNGPQYEKFNYHTKLATTYAKYSK